MGVEVGCAGLAATTAGMGQLDVGRGSQSHREWEAPQLFYTKQIQYTQRASQSVSQHRDPSPALTTSPALPWLLLLLPLQAVQNLASTVAQAASATAEFAGNTTVGWAGFLPACLTHEGPLVSADWACPGGRGTGA